jgi:replicative DNA helicase Mcm
MDSLSERWRSYFEAECQPEIEAVAEQNSSKQSVTIDLVEVYQTDEELARAVLAHPDRVLPPARAALGKLVEASFPVRLRIENNPHLCDVSELSARRFHELVTVEGVVESVGPVQASTVTARYSCPACGESASTSSAGVEHDEPTRCDGCGWDGSFDFHPAESTFVDTQRFTLGPATDQRDDGPRPAPHPVYVHGDLVDEVTEGDHVRVTGVVRVSRSPETPLYTPYLDGRGIHDERDISSPDSLEAALDSYWDRATSSSANDG